MALEPVLDEDEREEETASEEETKIPSEELFRLALSGENIAEHLPDSTLSRIGQKCWDAYQKDKTSQVRWEEHMAKAVKLAMQVEERKDTPWDGASNVKMPILTVGALQFASRAYPAIVREPEPVKGKVNGQPTQAKLKRARRIGKHMSYQITEEIEGWVEDMDSLLHILPIWGCSYKKTYESYGRHSDLVRPDAIVFDYYAKDIESCRCKTEVIPMHRQEILEKQRLGIYREFPLDELGNAAPEENETKQAVSKMDPPGPDEQTPYDVHEQHTFYDIDGDGYEEPWIITYVGEGRQVCRIAPRFDEEGIKKTPKGSFVIKPIEYYTGYTFFPDPTGGVRGLGWGHVLYPINEAINSITNQLIDAGTLQCQQGGIIDETLAKKWPSGPLKIKMNEWVKVNGGMAQDIRQKMLPWPVKGPSPVLFQLLGLLIPWAQRLTSVTDSMAGDNPPTNQPATTTMALLEQGQKVFAGVHKRIYRSFNRELKKIKRLNRLYLPPEDYFRVLDATPQDIQDNVAGVQSQEMGPGFGVYQVVYRTDYDGDDADVSPSADPNVQTEAQLRARAQAVLLGLEKGMALNPSTATAYWLDSWDIPEADQRRLILPPMPKVDPKIQVETLKQQSEQKWIEMEGNSRMLKAQLDAQSMSHKQSMDEANIMIQRMGKELEVMRLLIEGKNKSRELDIKEKQSARSE